jgi:hypothetical protein
MNSFLSSIMMNFEKCLEVPSFNVIIGHEKLHTNYASSICGCEGTCDACENY